MRVTLASNCTNSACHKENVQLRYQWTLFLENPSNESWTRVDQLKSMASTPLNSSSLAIIPNTLIPGRNYRIKLDLDNIKDKSSSGFTVWSFTTHPVPSGGVCTSNTSSGVAVEQIFTLACSNWQDPNHPLLYEFIGTSGQGITTILSYGYSSIAELTLPPGDPLRNYSLTIDVNIINSVGSRVKTTIDVQVSVKLVAYEQRFVDKLYLLMEKNTVKPVYNGPVYSGHPLYHGYLTTSLKSCLIFTVKLTCI